MQIIASGTKKALTGKAARAPKDLYGKSMGGAAV